MRKFWSFDTGRNGFRYADDAFRFTDAPDYAKGQHSKSRGHDGGGALTLRIGGVDDQPIKKMSGGWTRSFELDEAQPVVLTFRYRLEQGEDARRKDYADVRVALDGETVEVKGKPYLARVRGDGPGDKAADTGWRTVEIDLGNLGAGRHEITLGGFANRKASKDAFARLLFDDVTLEGAPPPPKPPKLDAFEAKVLELTNAFRERHGRDPLENDATLNAAAEDWSREMAEGDFFDHSSLPGQITRHGYDPTGWGENIAAGYATPQAVVQGWIDSPGHRANMLRADFQHIGIGYYRLDDDRGDLDYTHYWTQTFGVPSDDYV